MWRDVEGNDVGVSLLNGFPLNFGHFPLFSINGNVRKQPLRLTTGDPAGPLYSEKSEMDVSTP